MCRLRVCCSASRDAIAASICPASWLKIYPDAAHGFLFQHHAEFAADVTEFLS